MDRRYGIYFIPPAESDFYQAGSAILGYDIRQQKVGALRTPEGSHLPTSAHYFGFHATIRGTFQTDRLSELDREIAMIIRDFSPIPIERSFIDSFSGDDRLIRFRPDPQSEQRLFDLHARAVTTVDALRIKDYVSPETQALLPKLGEKELRLIRDHGDPRVLEGYIFHFTLANNASSKQLAYIDRMIEARKGQLVGMSIDIDRLSLVEQESNDYYWKIVKEYRL
jgi:2'-5' RNA ligase